VNAILVLFDSRLCVTGVITLYRLYHNGIVIYDSSTACNLTMSGLQTWSAHQFRLETCTSVGCTSSPSILARTQENVPVGTVGLRVNGSSPRSVLVYWTPVSEPNGNLSYHVYFTGPFDDRQRTHRSFASVCLFVCLSVCLFIRTISKKTAAAVTKLDTEMIHRES